MLLPFPTEAQMAEAFLREAARHLQDARIFCRGKRYPGSITSSMKAVGLGLKSVLLVNGGTTRMASALVTHQVFAEIKSQNNPSLAALTRNFLDVLRTHDPDLLSDIDLMEKLIPFKPDIKKLEIDQAANTEYPFFASVSVSVPGAPPVTTAQLYLPETYYTAADSEKHFGTAYRLLSALQALSPEMKDWKVRLCRPL